MVYFVPNQATLKYDIIFYIKVARHDIGENGRVERAVCAPRLLQQSLGLDSNLVMAIMMARQADLGSFVPHKGGKLKSNSPRYDYSGGSETAAILREETTAEMYNQWLLDTCYGCTVKKVHFKKK